jgi:FkbM family methyltransferase
MALDRSLISRWLPTAAKQRLRPLLAPLAYAVERPRMRAFYGTVVGPGDLVFDIGAAEGFHAAVLADLGARVICVEPQPYCLEVLRRRFADDDRVAIVATGVGAEAGQATLHVSRGDPEISTFGIDKWRSGRFADHSWEDRVTVAMVTLDELVAEHGSPAFVKIDVEGFEDRVLSGLTRPLRWISFEFTRDFPEDAGRCVEIIEALGPAVFNATLFRRWRPMLDAWVKGEELLDRLAAVPGDTVYGDIHARVEVDRQARSSSKSAS